MGGGVRFTSNMGSVEIVLLTPVYRRGVVVYPAQDHLTHYTGFSTNIYDVAEYSYHSIDVVCT